MQAQAGEASAPDPNNKQRSGSPGQRRRGNSPGQRQARLPGLGANNPKTSGGPRQRTPYQMDQSAGLNGQRRPTPRRGARGTGFSPRGTQPGAQTTPAQQAAQQAATAQQSQGWTSGSEAPGHVTTAKLSPRKGQAPDPNNQKGDAISPPDSPPQDEASAEARSLGSELLDGVQRAELEELRLDLEAARSAASKAEAERELAGVQAQVMQQEFEMESKRMGRETQILQVCDLVTCSLHLSPRVNLPTNPNQQLGRSFVLSG